MNNIIRQLAEQAGVSIDGMGFGEGDVEGFAKLIVKECSKVIVHGGYWSGGPLGPKRQCTPPEIARMIEEHLGVKE